MTSGELVIVGDIGGTNCRVGVVSEDGIIDSETLRTPQDGDELFAQIGTQFSRFASIYGAGIGAIGVPGPVRRSSDSVLVGPFPNINGCNEAFDIEDRITLDNPLLAGFDILPLNDAEAATHAAAHFYATDDNKDPLMFLTLSTGVGGDISVNYETLSYTAGLLTEIGHTPIHQPDGSYQTLENLVSGTAISKRYSEGQRTAEELSRDPEMLQIWDEVGQYLARGIGALVTTFGLRQVVIGGGVGANVKHLIEEPLNDELGRMLDVVPDGIVLPPEVGFVWKEHEQVLGLMGCFFAVKQRTGLHLT